jgi:Zn finger protein HypA/HybF involved in hydrogenase expression
VTVEKLVLDGNAAAGVLQAVYGVEVTTAVGTCDGCGTAGPVGAARLYRAAGLVLRCPHCDAVLMKVVTDGERIWIDSRGLRSLQFDAG